VRFIVANYGMRHVGMLLAHLHSVVRTHPDAAITVYWQDIPDTFIEAVRAVAPRATFTRTEFDFAKDPLQRISSKVLCWARAAEEYEAESELVFCDSDTLVRRDLQPFFKTGREHVVITAKPESVPLNSGVILARGSAATTAFFRAWREETIHILRTPELFTQANDPARPYGGPDQMSLYRLLSYRTEASHYVIRCGEHDVRLRAEPCAQLNETNSRPLSDEIHVVHYKAGWQRILLDGRPFSRFRPREASWQMLDFFLTTFSEALRRSNRITGCHRTAWTFGIRWPWYYKAGQFNAPAYAAWRLKEAAKRTWLFATGRLKPGM
jgi:hypothetical protein